MTRVEQIERFEKRWMEEHAGSEPVIVVGSTVSLVARSMMSISP